MDCRFSMPSHSASETVAYYRVAPHLQWRDRAGFSPVFPFKRLSCTSVKRTIKQYVVVILWMADLIRGIRFPSQIEGTPSTFTCNISKYIDKRQELDFLYVLLFPVLINLGDYRISLLYPFY
jgi:hypothetical protein